MQVVKAETRLLSDWLGVLVPNDPCGGLPITCVFIHVPTKFSDVDGDKEKTTSMVSSTRASIH